MSLFSGMKEPFQPDIGGKFDGVLSGLLQSNYGEELLWIKCVKQKLRKQNPEKFWTQTTIPEVYGK